MKFYSDIPSMECLAGDTLDTFEVDVENLADYQNPKAHVQLSRINEPTAIELWKECSLSETGFSVSITSADTEKLKGCYYMDFIITSCGNHYKKLRGILHVYPHVMGDIS